MRLRKIFPILFLLLLAAKVSAQNTRISATLTVTNASGTTNGQTLSIASQNIVFTNNPALSPSIYVTNGGQNVTATNLYLHIIAYPPATSITNVMLNTNQLRIDGTINAPLSVTPSAGWATVTYTTNTVSGVRTWSVRMPWSVEQDTNQTNIASMLMTGLVRFAESPPITNGSNLAISNATVKPLWLDRSGSLLQFLSLEQGSGLSLTRTPTSIVASATSGGITNLNGLTNLTEWFTVQATGTDFTISTSTNAGVNGTNFLNLPLASTSSTGKLSATDWNTFNRKQPGSTLLTNLSATGAHTNAAVLLYRGPTNSGIGAPLILKAGTGITLSTNNGTNFLISAAVGASLVTNDQSAGWSGSLGLTNGLTVVKATLTGDTEFMIMNLDLGRTLDMRLTSSGGDYAVTFPCLWKWETALPTVLSNGQFAHFELRCFGTNNEDAAASWLRLTNSPCSLTASNATITMAHDTTHNSDLDNFIDNPCAATVTSYEITTAPLHGIIGLNTSSGAFSYTPTASYSGPDSFAYWAIGPCRTEKATVSITVTP